MSKITSIDYNELISNHTIISRTNLDGIITYVNDKFCELSGYSEEELLGQSHNIVRHPDTSSKVYEELWQHIKNNQIYSTTLRNIAKNGEEYYIKATIIPLMNEKGEKEGYMSIHYHVTEDKVEKSHLKKQLILYKSEQIKRSKENSLNILEYKKMLEYEYSEKYLVYIKALKSEVKRLRIVHKQDINNINSLEEELKENREYVESFNIKSKNMINNLSKERITLLESVESLKKSNKSLEEKFVKAQESVVVFQTYIDEYRKKIDDLNDVIANYEKEKRDASESKPS